jgi:cell division septation protein DedD
MEIDVTKHVVNLLFQHDIVSLPGLGSFVGAYKSANLDQVQGSMSPPSKQITFDENLRMDDGLLVQSISREHGVTYDAARSVVDDFVRQIREAIDRREIIAFGTLGRLYRDFESSLQFLPDVSTNYHSDSFGLPDTKAVPTTASADHRPDPEPTHVPSSEPAAPYTPPYIPPYTPPTPPPRVEETPAYPQTTQRHGPEEKPIGSSSFLGMFNKWLADNLTLVAAVTAIVLAITLFTFLRNSFGGSDENVNQPPPVMNEDAYTEDEPLDFPAEDVTKGSSTVSGDKQATVEEGGFEEEKTTPPPPSNSTKPAENKPKPAPAPTNVDAPTPAPSSKTCIIVIGSFGNQANVTKLLKEISEAGYATYSAPNGALTRVGIQFPYSTPAEVDAKLREVRSKFDKGAIVFKR